MKDWNYDKLDPSLKSRVRDALRAAGIQSDLRHDAPGPPSGHPQAIKTPPRRIRQSQKPLLNKLEQEYYDKFLTVGQTSAPVCVQAVRFRLANGLWYKPDFFTVSLMVLSNVAIEVKGPHSFRGGFENLKMAAHQYPWIKWILVWKQDGQWQEQTVLP